MEEDENSDKDLGDDRLAHIEQRSEGAPTSNYDLRGSIPSHQFLSN